MSKKTKHIGPGGIGCPCCRPPQMTKKETKRFLSKEDRRKAKEALKKEIGK